MKKLLKNLKPYKWTILLIVIMVAATSIASLYLPDRMSKIIGEGITTEIVYEESADGRPIYISVAGEISALPKIIYNGAGILVTEEIGGKLYAKIIGVETDSDNNPLYTANPATGESIPVPKFLRTTDGNNASLPTQGTLSLTDSGGVQVEQAQISKMDVIWQNGLIMLAITLVSSILSIMVAYFSSKVGVGLGRDLRSKLFAGVTKFSQSQEDKFSTASLITRTTNDVMQIQNLIIMALRMMINVPFMFVGGLIMALNKDSKMTLVLLVTIPIVAGIILLVAKKIIPVFRVMQNRIDRLTLVSRENITGVRVIRAFGGETHEYNRFTQANKEVTEAGLTAARYMSVLFPIMMLIMSLTSISIVFISTFSINSGLKAGNLDFTKIGNMMAVIQYIMQIMMSVIMFSIVFIMVPRASVSATRINEVLETKSEIRDPDNPVTAERKGSVEFKEVSFAFSDSSTKNVIENISFSAEKGTVTAIIGGTGSGKSTLINLISRQFDATKGKVLVDGVDVREMSLKDLHSRIGFVTQNAVLFSGSIKDNILYGAESEEKLAEASDISQASEFIFSKEGGLDAVVEQGGGNFSGGQKQRLSIARALATDAEILIFDDSFSALDFATDAKLRKALKKEAKDKTIIIVAQRIGTVMDSDRIIVLDNGRLAGIGSHKELMKNCEEYRDIALSQLSEAELGL